LASHIFGLAVTIAGLLQNLLAAIIAGLSIYLSSLIVVFLLFLYDMMEATNEELYEELLEDEDY
jgi:hypothetical protein